jgi:UDP-glucose 4-epimerase
MNREAGILLVGAGFIGSAFARCQLAAGTRLAVLTRHGVPELEKLGAQVVVGRQENCDVVASLLSQFDTVIHFACSTNPAASHADPALEEQEYLTPFRGFLEAASNHPPRNLIFVSSGGTIYGDPARLPVDECAPTMPLSPHGQAKLEAEHLIRQFADIHGVRLSVLRPSNIYGPGQNARPGFGVIPTVLDCASFGRVFRVRGDSVRDYLYIDDMVAALDFLVKTKAANGIFNVGSGQGTSLRQLVAVVQKVSGKQLHCVDTPELPGAVNQIVLDTGRLTAATGWKPRMTLENGIARTWEWIQNSR